MSSTPISKLPVHHPNLQISGDSQEDDPEVQAVLQEVQQRQPTPTAVQTQMYAIPSPPQMMMAAPRVTVATESTNPWVQQDMAKKAVIAAVLAALLFHPKTLTLLYERVSFLQKFESYDLWIRMALLAVVLYVLMIKLKL